MIQKNIIDESKFTKLCLHPQKLAVSISLLNIKKENIYRAMGMNESQVDNYVSGLIDHFIEECKKIGKPLACYSIFQNPHFNINNSELILNEVNFSMSRTVMSSLKNSSFIAVFVSTCGEKIEQLSKHLIDQGNTLEGFIVDLIGSEIAEEIASNVHQKIENIARDVDLRVTNRYSPGYCNWPVSDQQKLFSILQGNNCGIHLTPSSLMVPIKSVSGMIGIGPNVRQVAYKCKLCSDEKCILRKIK